MTFEFHALDYKNLTIKFWYITKWATWVAFPRSLCLRRVNENLIKTFFINKKLEKYNEAISKNYFHQKIRIVTGPNLHQFTLIYNKCQYSVDRYMH